jgi:hypothetical protein
MVQHQAQPHTTADLTDCCTSLEACGAVNNNITRKEERGRQDTAALEGSSTVTSCEVCLLKHQLQTTYCSSTITTAAGFCSQPTTTHNAGMHARWTQHVGCPIGIQLEPVVGPPAQKRRVQQHANGSR